MITIGERIKEAIDYMEKGKIEHALTPTYIALDLTSKKVAGKDKSAKSDYKKFISDYMWLITYMGLPSVMTNAVKVHFSHPDIKSDAAGYCNIEDVVYHVIRCGLIHSTGLDSKIQWSDDVVLGGDGFGNLIISSKFIWGLIGAIIFCPKNHNESIEERYWIKVGSFQFFIQEVWGRLDLAKRAISINTGIQI